MCDLCNGKKNGDYQRSSIHARYYSGKKEEMLKMLQWDMYLSLTGLITGTSCSSCCCWWLATFELWSLPNFQAFIVYLARLLWLWLSMAPLFVFSFSTLALWLPSQKSYMYYLWTMFQEAPEPLFSELKRKIMIDSVTNWIFFLLGRVFTIKLNFIVIPFYSIKSQILTVLKV